MAKHHIGALAKDTAKRTAVIREFILGHKHLSVHDMVRDLLKQGVPTNNDEVGALRRQFVKNMSKFHQAIDPVESVLIAVGLKTDKTEEYFEVLDKEVLSAPIPIGLALRQNLGTKLQEAEAEKLRKQKLQEERAQAQAERAKAQEEKWAKEREEVAKKEKEQKEQKELEEKKKWEEAQKQKQPLDDTSRGYWMTKLAALNRPEVDLGQVDRGSMDSAEGRLVRDRWVEDFFLLNPEATSTEASMTMQEVFGIGRDANIITDVMKQVRALSGLPYRGRKSTQEEHKEVEMVKQEQAVVTPEPRVQVASSASAAIIPLGTPVTVLPILLYWPWCDQPEFTNKENLNASIDRLVSIGVKREDIRVFREVKTRTKVVVSTELDE